MTGAVAPAKASARISLCEFRLSPWDFFGADGTLRYDSIPGRISASRIQRWVARHPSTLPMPPPMMRIRPLSRLILLAAIGLPASFGSAQVASFASYTKPCPSFGGALGVTGVPRLGTTFTVERIRIPYGCTYQFCGCTVGRCKRCTGAVLYVGAICSG